jgi:ABC-type nitrate/sulfonate/bicarbonate transport system substrate-binding protein
LLEAKIAINLVKSSFHYTWLMALKAAGLNESDVQFVILPFDQQEMALEKGQVDAIGLMQPYILHAKESGKYKVLFNASNVFGDKQFSTHVLNSVWAKDHEKTATAFVTSIAQAENWIENNQQEAKAIIPKYTGVDVKYIQDYHFQKNGEVNLGDAQYWLDYMKARGDLKVDWLKVSDFATNKYNGAVK